MINLNRNEKILMVLHRHWIVMFLKFFLGLIFLIFPLLLFSFLTTIPIDLDYYLPIFAFSFVVYLMILVLILFIFWADYHLDMWIITNERIVDVEQKGLFYREISEFALERVQDVTIEMPGMLPTLLGYGNIIIQTAGEKSFHIKQVPRLNEAKDLILQNTILEKNERT
ncbi:PH domain-containing protein [Candidatus Giovannonibacteria bacterium]|nr:PH domain-containing protein [Candidatus Giovannonibacteria bacterium]